MVCVDKEKARVPGGSFVGSKTGEIGGLGLSRGDFGGWVAAAKQRSREVSLQPLLGGL